MYRRIRPGRFRLMSPIWRWGSPAWLVTKARRRNVRQRRMALSGRIHAYNPLNSSVPPSLHCRVILPHIMRIGVICNLISICKMQDNADKKYNPLEGKKNMKASSRDILQEV